MDKIFIMNSDNVKVEADAIRYFKYNNDYYLIFTYNELDESGKQILYIVQILDELNEKITRNINDMDEWNNIQVMIKDSIKQIKNGNDNNVEKLNIYELNEIKVDNPREFRIDPRLVKLLDRDILDDNIDDKIVYEELDTNMNKNFVRKDNDVIDTNTINKITDSDSDEMVSEKMSLNNNKNMEQEKCNVNIVNDSNDNSVDYKKMYFALKEDSETTEKLLNELLEKLAVYKEKFGELS